MVSYKPKYIVVAQFYYEIKIIFDTYIIKAGNCMSTFIKLDMMFFIHKIYF